MSSFAKPSTGVVAASVVAFVLSAALALSTILAGLAIYVAPASTRRPGGPAVLVAEVFFACSFFSIAGFGACMATGLLRLRNWARVSAIALAGIMAGVSSLAVLIGIVLLFRTVPNAPQAGAILVRVFFLMIYIVCFFIGVWWLILFTRKGVVEEFTSSPLPPPSLGQDTTSVPEVAPVQQGPEPFTILRGRAVLGRIMLAFFATIAAAIVFLITGRIVVGRSFDLRSPMILACVEVFFYGFLFLLILQLLRRARVSLAVLFGQPTGWTQLRRYWALPLFLIGVSLASYFAVYFPLSYVAPRFVDWLLFRSEPRQWIHSSGFGYQVANILSMLTVVAIAPIVEEFVFRGILLTRWSGKWGAPRGIVLSSVIFGLLHKEFLGHMFFAFVMCVLYIETKSLFLPILMHAANNTLAWGAAMLAVLWGADSKATLATFQAQGRWGLIVSAIFIPLAIRFIWRHAPKDDWKTPCGDSLVIKSQITPGVPVPSRPT